MSRNLDVRIEVSCPVFDKKIQKELRDMLDIQWSDTVKARKLFLSSPVTAAIKKPIRAQVRIYDYLKTGK
jgi:polyphosphate kinase